MGTPHSAPQSVRPILYHLLFVIVLKPFSDFYFYLRIELSHIDEIRDGEFGMVEEVMKLHQQVHVLRQFLVKTLIPVGRRTVHSCECFK